MDAHAKLKAENGLTETKIILGWLLNFCTLMIALPENKYIAYSTAISETIKCGWTTKAELERNIGQWVHIWRILPFIHHFLSNFNYFFGVYKTNEGVNWTSNTLRTFNFYNV